MKNTCESFNIIHYTLSIFLTVLTLASLFNYENLSKYQIDFIFISYFLLYWEQILKILTK